MGLPLSSDNKEQLTKTVTNIINQIPDLSRDPQGPVVEISDALCKYVLFFPLHSLLIC